ncbi:MAG: lysozyme inhibitor LprI family protein [Pseudorhodobacter sp.]|nr:lysozyme inhibitor LprI family protein [Pseudorhodobacter sp.]
MSLRLALAGAVAASGIVVPLAVLAQQFDCSQAGSQNELTWCAEQDWIAQDADLNRVYRQARALMQQIDADLPVAERGAEVQLRNAQRGWITYRDAACAVEGYMFHGGTAEPMIVYGCRARLTGARTADLRALLAM